MDIGTELDGRYQVLAELGRGGMGQVYLVKHLQTGRQEALKVLRPELAASPESVSRLRREARAVNRLHHSNIITMYDFGRLPDGRYYLTMEFAEGESLAKVLEREGPPPVSRTVDLLKQACRALDHAHQRGVIHRDLKPDNLFLAEHRGATVLKVLDFGLAKIIDAGDKEKETLATPDGTIYGTPSYMAPEQLMGDAHDERTDIYSLGCVAFELLAGQRPFLGRTIHLVTAHLALTPPSPSELRPGALIPPELEALVLSCLAKQPSARPQSARQLLASLEAFPNPPERRVARHPTYVWYLAGNESTIPGMLPEMADAGFDDQSDEPKEALRDAAEILLDGGCSEVPLVLAIGEVEQLDREEAMYNLELDALAQQAREFEQRARAHEASLRFQIAEMRLARLGTDPVADQLLDAKIQALNSGLTELFISRDDQLRKISDREVEIISALHARELKVEQAYAELSLAIGRALTVCEGSAVSQARTRFERTGAEIDPDTART